MFPSALCSGWRDLLIDPFAPGALVSRASGHHLRVSVLIQFANGTVWSLSQPCTNPHDYLDAHMLSRRLSTVRPAACVGSVSHRRAADGTGSRGEVIVALMKLVSHAPPRVSSAGDRVDIIATKWPPSWGTETTLCRPDFLAATPLPRIPALVIEYGERLDDSSLICEYLNDELGDYRLCPQSGCESWHILSAVSVATSGVTETQVMRRAEMLRKRGASQHKQEFSPASSGRQWSGRTAAISGSTSCRVTSVRTSISDNSPWDAPAASPIFASRRMIGAPVRPVLQAASNARDQTR